MEFLFSESSRRAEAIKREQRKTSHWRRNIQARRWPNDSRNLRAADALDLLASSNFEDVDPSVWSDVESYANSLDFRNAVSETNREVIFQFIPENLDQFLVRVLSKLPN